jgi:hypothetical protein
MPDCTTKAAIVFPFRNGKGITHVVVYWLKTACLGKKGKCLGKIGGDTTRYRATPFETPCVG